VKITPGHDHNDYAVAKRHNNIQVLSILNKDATINQMGGKRYAGMDRFVCRQKIWEDLQAAGLAVRVESYLQRVPRCQRSGDIIEPLISTQWFLRTKGMADKAMAVTRAGDLQILPLRFEKTWYSWLDNIHDWCISRQLWWGHR
jgi:valyl-tRNA synthetase